MEKLKKNSKKWGGGEVTLADGLRFVTPVRTINSGPNPKYFNAKRGIRYYDFSSDQFTGFHGIVIPGTLRDSLFILKGLLEQETILRGTLPYLFNARLHVTLDFL